MTPKDGNPCTAITPVDADDALDADNAEAGALSATSSRGPDRAAQQYNTATAKPFKAPETEEEKKESPSWIEIELLDSLGNPVPGEQYRIETPDGSIAEGALDEKGFVRVDGIKPGSCKVSFPGYDGRSWRKK